MTREIAKPADGQPLTTTRRDLLKFAALAGAGAGVGSFAAPIQQDAAALQATPTAGGSLNVGVAAELKVLDPHITTFAAYATTLRFTIFETLVEADEDGNYIPSLAESWEFADDGMSMTLNLVRGALFHNGKEFTSEDVAFTVDRIKNPELPPSSRRRCRTSTAVETPDEYTAVLKFAAPTPAILDYLLNVQIVTEQDIDHDRRASDRHRSLRVREWVLNDHITLSNSPITGSRGLPYLDEIVFRPILDVDTRLTNLQAGSLRSDRAAGAEGRRADRGRLEPAADRYPADLEVRQLLDQHPEPADVRPLVRQAMSFAFDRESYVRDILYGFGLPPSVRSRPATGPIDAAICDPYLSSISKEPAHFWRKRATRAGRAWRGSRYCRRLAYPELKSAAVLLQANLAALGINATVTELELAAWIDRLVTQPDYVMSTDTYGYGDVDPSTFFTRDSINPGTNVQRLQERGVRQACGGGRHDDRRGRAQADLRPDSCR